MSSQQTLPTNNDTQTRSTTINGDTLTTQNIHATGTLGTEINLHELITALDNSTNHIDEQGWVSTTYEITTDNGTTTTGRIQLWHTGIYTITGITTTEQLKQVETRFLNELDTIGVPITDSENATVSNYVATLDLDNTDRMNLDAVSITLGLENIEYEPDQFPGVLYRPANHDGTCLIFGSGKVTIIGVTSPDTMHELTEHVQTQMNNMELI